MANDIALEYQTAFLYEDDQSEYVQCNDYRIERIEDTPDNKNKG